MTTSIVVLFIITVLSFVVDGWIIIETGKKGIRKIFGRRVSWKIFDEGFHFKWPLVEDIDQIPIKRITADVVFSLTTLSEAKVGVKAGTTEEIINPGLEIFIEGEAFYEPDLLVYERDDGGHIMKGRVLYDRTGENPEAIKSDITSFTKSAVGILGGEFTGAEFVGNRKILLDIVNCYLRFSAPPHLSHYDENNRPRCENSNCKYPGIVEPKNIFGFYQEHREWVAKLLRGEHKNIGDRSPIEEREGINVLVFNLSKVDFSEDVKKAFEEQAETKSLSQTYRDRVDLASYSKRNLGLTGREAWDSISETFNEEVTGKQIFSLQHEPSQGGGPTPIVVINAPGGKK